MSQEEDSIIIMVQKSRRGYAVSAVGAEEKFHCRDAAAIGDAVLDILEDPAAPRAEIEEPAKSSRQNHSHKSAGRGSTSLERKGAFRPEPDEEPPPQDVMIGGRRTNTKDIKEAFLGEMDLADQMALSAFNTAWSGLQRVSNWRGKGGKKKKKGKG
jgi:hypothetical protein